MKAWKPGCFCCSTSPPLYAFATASMMRGSDQPSYSAWWTVHTNHLLPVTLSLTKA